MAIEKNAEITIRRAGNGFIVSPARQHGYAVLSEDDMVFQDMGLPGPKDGQKSEDTLCGWIDQHFSDEN